MNFKTNGYEAWPALPYLEFKATGNLLHMVCQMIGKLKLTAPFEPEWANVTLLLNSQGLTTGVIPCGLKALTVRMNLFTHEIQLASSDGQTEVIKLRSMSVAELFFQMLDALKKLNLDLTINPKPQELMDPILFNEDKETKEYKPELANAWFRILLSSSVVLNRYHARFLGKTQPLGFMWGTFDLRDVRYNGKLLPMQTTGIMSGYIRRNAMDEELIETGWWSGNEQYPRPAYYSFTFPQPPKIEDSKILPVKAHWDANMGEFMLDYDDVRLEKDPALELLAFFDTTYQAGAKLSGWSEGLLGSGMPK